MTDQNTGPNDPEQQYSPYQAPQGQYQGEAQPSGYYQAPQGQQSPGPQTNPYAPPYAAQYPGQYPPVPYGYPVPQRTDGLAIAALVTGILGFALIPLVLGIVSLNNIKKTGAGGRGMAIAGIVLGALESVLWVALIILVVIGIQAGSDYGLPEGSATFDQAAISQELEENPDLLPLYTSCVGGDDEACDDLYMDAGFGSELEKVADTCGGRGRDGLFCE